jgi:hypothetical protein
MFPGAFYTAKQYGGWFFEPNKPKKLKISGLESEKREVPEITKRSMRRVLEMTFANAPAEEIKEFVRQFVTRMLNDPLAPELAEDAFERLVEGWDGNPSHLPEMPERAENELRASDFLIACRVRSDEDYDSDNFPQLQAAKIWRAHNVVTAPKPGDQVTFGYALGEPKHKRKAFEMARPAYEFTEGKIQPDRVYIFHQKFENAIRKALSVVLKPWEIDEVLDVERYERIVGVVTQPPLFAPKQTGPRIVKEKARFLKTYAGKKRDGDVMSMLANIEKKRRVLRGETEDESEAEVEKEEEAEAETEQEKVEAAIEHAEKPHEEAETEALIAGFQVERQW